MNNNILNTIPSLNSDLHKAIPPNNGGDGTDAALTEVGASVYEKTVNGITMWFPYNTVGTSNAEPSEAWGYYAKAYAKAGDKDAFQKLLNGFYYLANQSNIDRINNKSWTTQDAEGLLGWNIQSSSFGPGTNPFTSGGDLSTAYDADEDVIDAMIQARQKFGPMTAEDPETPVGTKGLLSSSTTTDGKASSMDLDDLIKLSINSFAQGDFENKDGKNVVTMGWWQGGHDEGFEDYYDPMAFLDMSNYLKANTGAPSSAVQFDQGGSYLGQATLTTDLIGNQKESVPGEAQDSWTLFSQEIANNGGWVNGMNHDGQGTKTANDFDGNGEASRAPLRMANYILYCQKTGTDPLNLLQDTPERKGILSTAQELLANILSSPDLVFKDGGQGGVTMKGAAMGMISGPLYALMTALDRANLLTPDQKKVFPEVVAAENYSLNLYKTAGYQYFQQTLAILGDDIVREYPSTQVNG